jgi:GcrA cell cycle regulator
VSKPRLEHMKPVWSDDRAELAKQHFLNGRSGSEIAAELGGGLTRSAVMGKLARMGVQRPRKTHAPSGGKKRSSIPKPPRSPKPAPRQPATPLPVASSPIEPVPAPVEERGLIRAIQSTGRGTCRAPIGDPAQDEFQFCGAPCEGPYCSSHASRFVQVPLRRRRAA